MLSTTFRELQPGTYYYDAEDDPIRKVKTDSETAVIVEIDFPTLHSLGEGGLMVGDRLHPPGFNTVYVDTKQD